MNQRSDILTCVAALARDLPETGWDRDSAASVLEALADFTETELAPTNADADRQGCTINDDRVHMPDALVTAYRQYVDLGWHQLHIPADHGGAGAPAEIALAATEMMTAANHAFQMVVGLVPGAVKVLNAFGTEDQKQHFIPPLVAGDMLATMCLSESGAGSDLGAIRCKAVEAGNGTYEISGEKIFVSGGDQNLSKTILHLVLARTGTMDEGVKGLSLFACPADQPDRIKLLRIEEKLGLHASPTCQLSFNKAAAQLLGQPGDGLAAMFVLMNEARLDVAMQGVAHAARAHDLAATYAADRAQGRIDGAPTMIDQHGDVQRMLTHMDALAFASRVMALNAATRLDNADLAAFLTPVCKVWCTEAGSVAADLGIQILGGYGYLPEYGLEQIWRDSRVTRIYEGTNGVLSMTLVKRLLSTRYPAPRQAFEAEIERLTDASGQNADAVRHLHSVWQIAADRTAQAGDNGAAAFPLMKLTGLLYFYACWQAFKPATDLPADRLKRLDHAIEAQLLPEADSLALQCQRLLGWE